MRSSVVLFIAVLIASCGAVAQEAAPAPAPAPEAAPAPAPAEAAPAPAPAPEAAPAPAPAEAAPPALQDIRQVQIDVWITETGEEGLRRIGTNLNYERQVRGQELNGTVEQVTINTTDFREYNVTLPVPDTNPYPDNVRLTPEAATEVTAPNTLVPGGGVLTPSGAGVTATILDVGSGTIDVAFRSIEQKADTDLISKPELLVMNGQPAEIHAGEEIPYQELAYDKGVNQLQVTWRDVGVNMVLTPMILPDGLIEINLGTLDVVDQLPSNPVGGVDLPVFSTRKQTGRVRVPNGQTLVIGGLATRNLFRTERGVPYLRKVPVLGIPFRSRRAEARNTNLLLFVSPTIVDLRDLTDRAVDAMAFWQRDRWQNELRVNTEVELMQDEM